MSIPVEKLADIDNGLEIAEFIQKNREQINKTYGRSAISSPTTRERAEAWSKFIEETNAQDDGSQGGGNSKTRNKEAKSTVPNRDVEKDESVLSAFENCVSDASSSGDNSSRDAVNSVESDPNWEIIPSKNNLPAERGRDPLTSGGGESVQSLNNTSGVTESDGWTDREKLNTNNVPDDQGLKSGLKETTNEDLQDLIGEADAPETRRLKNANQYNEIQKKLDSNIPVVKKTTGGNTQLKRLEVRLESPAGATQCVPQSPLSPGSFHASVESAQKNVQDASMNDESEAANQKTQLGSSNQLEKKLDLLVENQAKMLIKLNAVLEVKEELAAIKKMLTNHSLALSTLDKYISDLMIVIPKSGVCEDQSQKEVNPDLRMVIGRDKNRGIKEVTKRREMREPIEIPEEMFVPPEVDNQYILKDIDNNANNAANFVPTDDLVSKEIICNIIKKNVESAALRNDLLDLVQDSFGKIPLQEIYETIKQLI